MKSVRNRLTYANVMSTLAVFLVVAGGSAMAATQLGKNTVGTKQLKKEAVTTAKVKPGAITESRIGNGSITNQKLAPNAVTSGKSRTTRWVARRWPTTPSRAQRSQIMP